MHDNTTGRVAVITGASSGIGEATARALAADGYRVALLARRGGRIDALADELGNGSIAIAADVTDRDGIVAAAERVQQELGGADVLVNNAGVMLLGPFGSEQRDDYRQMIEVNLLGVITATEVFLDQLKDGGGDIVNISSVAGRTARAGNGVYAATKWGINGRDHRLLPQPPPAPRHQRDPAPARGAGMTTWLITGWSTWAQPCARPANRCRANPPPAGSGPDEPADRGCHGGDAEGQTSSAPGQRWRSPWPASRHPRRWSSATAAAGRPPMISTSSSRSGPAASGGRQPPW